MKLNCSGITSLIEVIQWQIFEEDLQALLLDPLGTLNLWQKPRPTEIPQVFSPTCSFFNYPWKLPLVFFWNSPFLSSIVCYCLAAISFLNWKLYFIFLIWTKQVWIWSTRKVSKKKANIFFNFWIFVQIYQSIV